MLRRLQLKAPWSFLFLMFFLFGCAGAERRQAPLPGKSEVQDERALMHYARGKMAAKLGDHGRAASELHKALAYAPGSASIARALLASLGDVTGSEEMIDSVAAALAGREDTAILLQLGEAYWKQGGIEKARHSYELAHRLEPKMMEPLFYLGFVSHQQGRYGKAAKYYRRAMRVDGEESAELHYYLALSLERMELHKLAIDSLLSALRLVVGDFDIYYHLAYNYERLGEMAKAAEVYRKLLVLRPDEVRVRHRLVRIYYDSKKWPRAIAELTWLIGQSPDQLALRARRGQAYYYNGDYARAAADFSYVTARDPDDTETRFRLGVTLETDGHVEAAAAVYQRLLEEGVEKTEVLVRLAFVYQKLEQEGKMVAALEAAVELSPDDTEIRLLLAHAYSFSGQLEKSAAVYEDLKRRDPDNEDARYNLGVVYDKLGEAERATAEFRQVIRINPKNADAYNYIGYTYAEKGIKLDEAIRLIKKALRLDPGNGLYLDSLGWAYYRKGRLKKAEKEIVRAISSIAGSGEADAVIYEHLGDIYYGRGKESEALVAWTRALELDPGNEALREKVADGKPEAGPLAD